jgi:tRNA nucleotidyltransferase (CCA-adding enzyme)
MKDTLSIITTHVNADFDAMASMLAAQKLYPEARVVFPGSQDKNLRNFLIKTIVYLLNIADINHIDFTKIDRLILVDTRQPGRIGKFAQILDKPDLQIHIYDHHPAMAGDIKGHSEIIHPTGATVTILAEILQTRGIEITQDEATIMCLGIYEDTGSFTFSSTTKRDFEAAAYLLGRGANLNLVADLIAREITPEQVGILNDMIQGAVPYNIKGIEIVLTTIKTDRYLPDFAFLVHKMINMENLDAIFALALMENKIYVVGRSRISNLDAGAVLTCLGGGGHASAASATVREKTLAQTEQELIQILFDTVESSRRAEDLMSSPAITVNTETTCANASDLLNRYSINALVVVDTLKTEPRLKGYITRQIIEKAMYHRLGDVPVREYMNTDMAVVQPESSFFEIQEKIIANKQRLMPVVKDNKILGVISRTDLLNTLVNRPENQQAGALDHTDHQLNVRSRNIVNLMRERLSNRLLSILKDIGQTADKLDYGAYVVGGFIRDLFLSRNNEDIDIVVEGDGIKFAKKYAKIVDGRVHTHAKFGTAVVIFPDGYKIDVASARMEYYTYPAALPIVEMSSIKLDLYRRDFSINTLAVRLNSKWFGTLIDFFSAQKDIKEKVVRVLHNLSFVEDPTRVFRAIRFEQRFQFTIGKLTARLIENAVRMNFFKRLSGKRLLTELKLILEEENPPSAFSRLNDFNLLKAIHPSISFNDQLSDLFTSIKKVLVWYDLLFLGDAHEKWVVYFLALFRHINNPKSMKEVFKRLELMPHYQRLFSKERTDADRCLRWLEQNIPVENSQLSGRLSLFKIELILYMMAVTPINKIKQRISYYLTYLRHIQISLSGNDLKDMDLEPGPTYRHIFDSVRGAKLDGKIKTREGEIEYARQLIKQSLS